MIKCCNYYLIHIFLFQTDSITLAEAMSDLDKMHAKENEKHIIATSYMCRELGISSELFLTSDVRDHEDFMKICHDFSRRYIEFYSKYKEYEFRKYKPQSNTALGVQLPKTMEICNKVKSLIKDICEIKIDSASLSLTITSCQKKNFL